MLLLITAAAARVRAEPQTEEVSPEACETFSKKARTNGSDLQYHVYPGAEHNFDDPGRKKQSVPANASATEDARRRAEKFFREHLGR